MSFDPSDLEGGIDYDKVKQRIVEAIVEEVKDEIKEAIQETVKDEVKDAIAESGPISTQDTGTHTNPRRYEKDHGFVSARVAVAAGPAATPIWAVGLAAINPAAGRTDGEDTTVYTLELENSTGGAVTAWLENSNGNRVSIDYHLADNDSVVIDFVGGKNFGDMDIYINASVAAVVGQITGTQG